jgi:DNA helicase-2/ATP-dependent DNA helicase PcrA
MDDDEIAALLDSPERLVTVCAPAGCGKTYQGAHYAARALAHMDRGRVLILTHTHAACGVFASATLSAGARVEIKTLDAFIVEIARIYHRSLDLPSDPAAWAQSQEGDFAVIAERVAGLLISQPMVATALALRYPIVIGDEHQDSSSAQHQLMMSLHGAGTVMRLFGDRMQTLYGNRTAAERQADQVRWDELDDTGTIGTLSTPHRWHDGSVDLGQWILRAREALENGEAVDLREPLPEGLEVIRVANNAQRHNDFRLDPDDRRPIDAKVNRLVSILVLSRNNDTVKSLRVFWNRRYPIWEGHTRYALTALLFAIEHDRGNAVALANATVTFLQKTSKGFANGSHGDRFVLEVREGCVSNARGKPALLQSMAQELIDRPDHIGVSRCLQLLDSFMSESLGGFTDIRIDYRREFRDAITLGDFADPLIALREINRRRAFSRPMPPDKALSTIHKAKGMECDHAIIMPCDRRSFSDSAKSRCLLYVALSRAKRTLTLVVPHDEPSPLLLLD